MYWPTESNKPKQFGKIHVYKESETDNEDFIHRNIKVAKANKTISVQMFHYLKWIDRSTPQSPSSMIAFVERIRELASKSRSGPIVVHCSAGIGRTGSFIAIDKLLIYLKTNKKIEVYNTILEMRQDRGGLVQTFVRFYIKTSLSI